MTMRLLIIALMVVAAISTGQAQTYPTRPVTVIVPYPAGGPTDQVARQIAPKFAAKLGQNFVVENVSGGGTNIAGQRVARSAPDGYTLFVHNLQVSANVSLYKSLPFDTEKDLLPIAMINSNPLVLVGRKTLEAKTLPELVAWMKTTPARMGHPGVGSTGHLATALLAQALNVEVTHIPYRGAAPMLQDTLGGHIDLFFATPQQVVGQFASGEVKVFGITSKDTSPQFPGDTQFRCDLRSETQHRFLADHAGAGRSPEADRRCARRRVAGRAAGPRNSQGLGHERHGALSQSATHARRRRGLSQKRDRALGPGGARQQDRGASELAA